MLLIDSLYINNSGGFRLLEYLVNSFIDKEINFFLLADARCHGKFDSCKHVRYMNASLWERKKFYKAKGERFSSVLCFGNIPAPIKLNVPVYTYFHNINLLTLAETHSLKVKAVSWLKREVFKHYKKNTDYWLVQTSNTAKELIDHLGESPERVKLMPFYELPDGVSEIAKQPHGDDYVFVAIDVPGKSHKELIEAWGILHKKGVDKTLHLTVQNDSPLVEKIKEAQNEGVKIVNHGVIPFSEVFELYKQSKAIIYPSHNESLGLGVVEAITAGCDVIGSDLPFLHSICKPSGVFNPYSAESIAVALLAYEKGDSRNSELTIYNHINELINLLTEKN
jgi:glycosyltransferase involved in cell wall biosynthesis